MKPAVLILAAALAVGRGSSSATGPGRPAHPTPGDPGDARARIEQLIVRSGAEVAVAYRTLDGRDELLIRPDTSFHAASTMKVPVMLELFRQARAGHIGLDDRLAVVNEFQSIVDGSRFTMKVSEDSDAEVYRKIGSEMSYRELCEAMITVSSNLATNLLIEKLGAKNIQRTVDALGAPGMRVLRGVEDGKAFQRGLNNTTTARALMVLMTKIAAGEAVDRSASEEMAAILKRQQFNDRIPAGLPAGLPVAHKTGEITKIQHDAAIVYAPRPFVLVVLVRGLQDAKAGSALAADIARIIYDRSQRRTRPGQGRRIGMALVVHRAARSGPP
jgi:beta-lactamase class A